ncbi:MAG: Gfo/Idh/MocA family protein [Promethearchaeota archaeon]
MKILFFGLGSIGTRHLKLLKKNYNHEIYAYRTRKEDVFPGIHNIYDLEEALKVKPDIAFITNPTSFHIETAIICLKAGITNLFIEKPLSDSLDNLDIFFNEIKKSSAIVHVGYSMRHNPIIKRMKELIDEIRDEIFYAQTLNSSYLPNWRPGRDYREIYSSKNAQGGGVILDLIHEFDFNEWFFGKIKSINGIYGKISSLEIDSEDFCDVIINFENNMHATIHLDYFGFKAQRFVRLLTPQREILADMIKKEISFISEQKVRKETFHFERNDYFEEQLALFLEGIEKQSKEIINVEDARGLLEKILKFKRKEKIIIN